MKKFLTIFIILIACISLTSCTVQQEVNADTLAARICKSGVYSPLAAENIFNGKSGYRFLKTEAGNELILRFEAADNTLQVLAGAGITLSCESTVTGTQKADFINLSKSIIENFTEENGDDITENLNIAKCDFEKDNFIFYETQNYRFSFITTKIGADFFAQSKKAVPDSSVIQSLSETQPFKTS